MDTTDFIFNSHSIQARLKKSNSPERLAMKHNNFIKRI